MDGAQEPDHRAGALHERQAVLAPRTSTRRPTRNCAKALPLVEANAGAEAGNAVPAGPGQLQDGEGQPERAQESANYFRACAALKSPFQATAATNLKAHHDGVSRNQVNLLIPNLGSTSLKYQILEMPSETVLGKGRLERVANYRDAIRTDPDRRDGDRRRGVEGRACRPELSRHVRGG